MGTALRPPREQIAAVWSLGDYPRIVTETISGLGERLVEACRIEPGMRVLDVGAGSGNATLPAARAGASVVALDPTPALLAACGRAAEADGLEVELVEGVAEEIPFEDGEFDVVVSCIGAMFAPDHRAAADELLRVCRSGGTLGMITWLSHGTVADLFGTAAKYGPAPPPGAEPPLLWGDVDHVRDLLGDGVDELDFDEDVVELTHVRTPQESVDYYRRNFGPLIATYQQHADDPATTQALDEDMLQWATRTQITGDRPRWELAYLLTRATRR